VDEGVPEENGASTGHHGHAADATGSESPAVIDAEHHESK